MSAHLSAGESCLLIDDKGRHYLIRLREGGEFHSHLGKVPHSSIIGREEGESVLSERGKRLVAMRPRFADYILKMRRGAQVVYPKDLGPIIVYGDVGPGATVLEAGTGSGALTMALVRAVGPTGRVVSVERRPDHAAQARATIERYFGGIPENLELRVGSVEDVVADMRPERIVLDLPEPWHTIEKAAKHMPGGGVLCAYVPTIPQMQQTVEALRGCFAEIMCFESLLRTWSVEGRSVRPDHRMVAHTGFITVARRILPNRP